MSLLPRNSTAFERDLEDVLTARVESLAVDISATARSADCPAALLPWLAHAMSVDVWDDAWPEARKRSVIARSFAVHRRKGTLPALVEALELIFGAGVTITEWWDYEGVPGTFRLTIPGFEGPAQEALLSRVVESTKPSHAHLDRVGIRRAPVRAAHRVGIVRHAGRRAIYQPIPSLAVPSLAHRVGIARRVTRRGTIGLPVIVLGSHASAHRVGLARRTMSRAVYFAAGSAPTTRTVYSSSGDPVTSGGAYVEASA